MASGTRAIIEQLRRENQTLRDQLAAPGQANEQLRRALQTLRDQLDDARRAAARQAAPSRRPGPAKVPEGQEKRPGCPPGHPGSYRAAPAYVDEQAEVPLGPTAPSGRRAAQ